MSYLLASNAERGLVDVPANAILWWRRAAALKDPEAQHALGVIHEKGQGVKRDFAEALRWFRLASDQGLARSTGRLGLMILLGQGQAANINAGIALMEKAGQAGDVTALHNLAYAYETGAAGSDSRGLSIDLYTQAAEKGYSASAFRLAVLYTNGQIVPRNFVSARKWVRICEGAAVQTIAPDQIKELKAVLGI